MKIFRDIKSWQQWRNELTNASIGFVPTMGALHDGHGSLVEAAKKTSSVRVVSIFVNPAQFNDPADLQNYPRPENEDLHKLDDWGVDAVFLPTAEQMYADNYKYEVLEKETSKILCGAHRPGHFAGVLTIVLKLFNIVRPDRAYFGEKDYQQLRLIRGMVDAFYLPLEIVPCPTVREADGLAMSSRNVRLSPGERELAARFPQILKTARNTAEAADSLKKLGFVVDYVEDRWGRRLAAVYVGKVRLIDNVSL